MKIKIKSNGLQAMINDLRDLEVNGPRRAQEALDAALRRAAAASGDLVHVSDDHRHGGALRASQSVSSEHGSGSWSGTIAYADRGAHFEMERGGEHAAFIDRLAALSSEDFEKALLSGFRDV